DWYSQSFGETYHRLHDHPFLDYRARSEAESIQSLLGERGTRILDLCCGWGSHSAALARLGYRVTGFDLSAHFLEKARATINKEGLDVELLRGDMRDLPFREQFDAVVFLGNSFGYFEDEADDLRTLEQVHKA